MRILVGTRKGVFRLEERRDGWHVGEPHYLGVRAFYAMRDPRDGSIWTCLGHGHWGPKLAVSRDDMKSFREVTCPAFPRGCEIDSDTAVGRAKGKASVRSLYTIVPAGPEPGHYHLGCDPGGLFTTRDGGGTWALNEALWKRRNEDGWFAGGGGGVMLHAILPEPSRPERLLVGVSCGGVYESTDGGASWTPRNRGVPTDFLPNRHPEVGQDTHMLARSRAAPDIWWQQNRCGVFRSADRGGSWTDVTPDPRYAAGFAIAVDDEDPATSWTAPMDSDERRVARDGALVVMRTRDGGATWEESRDGLPQRHCYDIVYRHALDARNGHVALGTTSGRLLVSADRGASWLLVAPYLPPINSVRFER